MTRVFLPSLLGDNGFLTKSDPAYRSRLEALPEREKKALLYGDWNIFEGQYFTEFSTERHVCEPFEIPPGWRRYRTIDYGLDRLAVLWIAVAPDGCSFVYLDRILRSPSTHTMWFIVFAVFFLLSKIADEITVISFVGFTTNLIGSLFFKLAKKYSAEADGYEGRT